MLLGILSAVTAGLFTGAAAYVTLVEHPARLSCGTSIAVTQWRPSYRRATVMQASLAASALVLSFATWWTSGRATWLVGGIMIGVVIPFTLLVMVPTNRRLADTSLDTSSSEAAALLQRWGRLHAVRTLCSAAAFTILLIALA
jgi:uncharacterized membrane protein